MAKPLLKEFDAISVREDYAVKLASEIYNVKAEQVIDAVFLLEKSDFVKVSADASYDFPKKFLFAFILNPTKDKRRQVECIANKLGLDIVCAPDAAVGYHKSFFEIFSGLKVINPLNVSNFLKAYEKASYIVTDSFHGTCFSYIYKKNFSVYFNYQRGADRFVALMKILELNNRRIYENQSDDDLIKNADIDFNVDWNRAESNITSERAKSWNWLFNALSLAKDKKIGKRNNLTIDVLPKNLCTGCSACFNGCPVDAISMIENEQGFYEPSIDYEKCIKCGKCERICPVLHPNRKNSRNPECYAVINNDEIRKDKVLCAVLKDSDVSIEYIVENASNPVPGFKTINRNAAEYLDCDVMLVADIYNFKEIKAKLEKMKVPFPFYNAAEFIQSLPAADGDGIDKIKEKIRNLNDRIVFEREEKERLDIRLSASAKREAELAEKVGTLTKRDTVSQEKIKSLSVDIKQLTATNRRVAEERDGCMGELESLKNSLSFRLGRAITFIPRKIRDAFKKSKK